MSPRMSLIAGAILILILTFTQDGNKTSTCSLYTEALEVGARPPLDIATFWPNARERRSDRTSPGMPQAAATTTSTTTSSTTETSELEDEDHEDYEPIEEEENIDEEDEANSTALIKRADVKYVNDVFGNRIKIEGNSTTLMAPVKARDFGLLTLKAILLGPLIGLTIKAALIRGLFWAVGAYLMHLFFPGVLGALGLGTGLVGFARQAQPDYAQMLLPHLLNLQSSLPSPVAKVMSQYRTLFDPVIEAIRSVPEGQCRFRAVCETAGYIVKNTQFMSSSLQRLSATVYLNFGTEYSKAWLDGVVQSDCAAKYAQCASSPFTMIGSRLSEALRNTRSSSGKLSFSRS